MFYFTGDRSFRFSTVGSRAFTLAGPSVWNALLPRSPESLDQFSPHHLF